MNRRTRAAVLALTLALSAPRDTTTAMTRNQSHKTATREHAMGPAMPLPNDKV
jgi:hypothetical protein